MFDKTLIYKRMRGYRMKGRLEPDTPLSAETSFRIGGPADILFVPDNIAEAVRVVKLCNREKIPLTILGNGTNVLVLDGGVRGIVMKLSSLCELKRERGRVFAGAGARLGDVCAYARDEGLSGLEFACGIPGSAGGAVCMNAGAYGGEMKDVVSRSVVLEPDGNICLFDVKGHGFAYRQSAFQHNGCAILETEFALTQGDIGAVTAKMEGYISRRQASQPMDAPSAGSVFRRPAADGAYVGPMIEKCGLKGARCGGAQVSDKHAGFIINVGGATAADVLALIERVRSAVYAHFCVELETEIRLLGEQL